MEAMEAVVVRASNAHLICNFADNILVLGTQKLSPRDEDMVTFYIPDSGSGIKRDEDMVTFYIPDSGSDAKRDEDLIKNYYAPPEVKRDEDMVTFYIPDGGSDSS